MILDVAGLSFSYNSHPILDGVSFHVPRGELVAVLGPNGVGKSTLLKCINAILPSPKGSIRIDGENLRRFDTMQIARRVGYVAQRSEAGRMTAFDAILMGRRPHIRWKVTDRDLRMTEAVIRRLGLEKLTMRHIDCMSGGELQKVAIARALVQEPRLMLLDEPTSSLDLKNQIEILTTIRRVVVEHGVGAIMTMHDLNTALRFAHRFLFLKDGRIFAAGKAEDVRADVIRSVYGLPVEVRTIGGHPVVLPLEPAAGKDGPGPHTHDDPPAAAR
jgi:iron complex transport system ATP-binding protein